MLIKTSEVKEMDDFKNIDEKILKRKLEAIENAIRSYTNNNFQNRMVRFVAKSNNSLLKSVSPYLKVNDTIEISESINKGLYVIKDITESTIELDREIFDSGENLITKIEYPSDIVEGALKLLKWDITKSDKVGISSETISRHSVSYVNLENTNTINGYPSSLFSFCNPYKKIRC